MQVWGVAGRHGRVVVFQAGQGRGRGCPGGRFRGCLGIFWGFLKGVSQEPNSVLGGCPGVPGEQQLEWQ